MPVVSGTNAQLPYSVGKQRGGGRVAAVPRAPPAWSAGSSSCRATPPRMPWRPPAARGSRCSTRWCGRWGTRPPVASATLTPGVAGVMVHCKQTVRERVSRPGWRMRRVCAGTALCARLFVRPCLAHGVRGARAVCPRRGGRGGRVAPVALHVRVVVHAHLAVQRMRVNVALVQPAEPHSHRIILDYSYDF